MCLQEERDDEDEDGEDEAARGDESDAGGGGGSDASEGGDDGAIAAAVPTDMANGGMAPLKKRFAVAAQAFPDDARLPPKARAKAALAASAADARAGGENEDSGSDEDMWGPDLIGDEADRARLNSLTEVDREKILSERAGTYSCTCLCSRTVFGVVKLLPVNVQYAYVAPHNQMRALAPCSTNHLQPCFSSCRCRGATAAPAELEVAAAAGAAVYK